MNARLRALRYDGKRALNIRIRIWNLKGMK